MLNLAITGSLYLFKDEINGTFFGYRYLVQPSGEALPAARITEIAASAVPGATAKSYKDPLSPEQSAVVTVSSDAGATLVFVNPYDGKVLDTVGSTDEFNYVVKRIHSLAYFGAMANRLTEIAGGFAWCSSSPASISGGRDARLAASSASEEHPAVAFSGVTCMR